MDLYKAFGFYKKKDEGEQLSFDDEWWNTEIENPSSASIPKTDHMDYNPDTGAALDRAYLAGKKEPPPDYPTTGPAFHDSTPWIDNATERDYATNPAFRRKVDHIWGGYHDPKVCPECAKKHADPEYGVPKPDLPWEEYQAMDWLDPNNPYRDMEFEEYLETRYPDGYPEDRTDISQIDPWKSDINKMLWKAFGIYKNKEYDYYAPDAIPIPESRGSLVHLHSGEPVPNLTPHEAADLAAQHGGGNYTADDGHRVALRPRSDGEPGLSVGHIVHGRRANNAWDIHHKSDPRNAIRHREAKANEWIQHFAEHPSVTQVSPYWEKKMELYDL